MKIFRKRPFQTSFEMRPRSGVGTPRLVSGRNTASWNGIVARAMTVLEDDKTLFILIEASGPDPRSPTKLDLITAQVTAFVFRRQVWTWKYRDIRAYLVFNNATRVEVPLNPDEVKNVLKSLRLNQSDSEKTPVPAVSYAICKRRP